MKGCSGGFATDAFQYVEDNDGIESEADNPYTAGDGDDSAACVEDGNYVATVNGTWDVEEGDEGDLKEAVAQQVGVDMLIILSNQLSNHYQIIYTARCRGHRHDR